MKLHLLTIGNHKNLHSSSGTPYHLYRFLKEGRDIELTVGSAELSLLQKWINRIISFNLNISNWREKSYKNKYCFEKCTENAGRSIKANDSIDYILQFQTMFDPGINVENLKIPFGIYTDYTIALAQKYYPQWAPFSQEKTYDWWFEKEKNLFVNATHIFTFSELVRQSIIQDYTIEKSKVYTVYAGGPTENIYDIQFENIDPVRKFIFVGKDYERKGVKYLIKAFLELQEEHHDIFLTIIGCEAKTNHCNIKNIPFINDRKVLLEHYTDSDVFVMPSLAEPFGYTYLEAMACGLPCIGTTSGGASDIIVNGETGFLVMPCDHNAIKEKMRWFIEHPDKTACFGKAGLRRFQEKFTWRNVVQNIVSTITEI